MTMMMMRGWISWVDRVYVAAKPPRPMTQNHLPLLPVPPLLPAPVLLPAPLRDHYHHHHRCYHRRPRPIGMSNRRIEEQIQGLKWSYRGSY